MAQKGILSYNVKDKQELYAAYMPFLINGGLFVPSTWTPFTPASSSVTTRLCAGVR
jgi:Tfp pilus assembly protein PilZ